MSNYTTPEWFDHAGQEQREEHLIKEINRLREENQGYRSLNDPLNPSGRDRVLNQERELQTLRCLVDELTVEKINLMAKVSSVRDQVIEECADVLDLEAGNSSEPKEVTSLSLRIRRMRSSSVGDHPDLFATAISKKLVHDYSHE
jgi:hypothetical protein